MMDIDGKCGVSFEHHGVHPVWLRTVLSEVGSVDLLFPLVPILVVVKVGDVLEVVFLLNFLCFCQLAVVESALCWLR